MVRAMKTPNIEYCLDQGMELQVTKGIRGDFLARVWVGTLLKNERNATGASIPAALEALEHLLSKMGPKP